MASVPDRGNAGKLVDVWPQEEVGIPACSPVPVPQDLSLLLGDVQMRKSCRWVVSQYETVKYPVFLLQCGGLISFYNVFAQFTANAVSLKGVLLTVRIMFL